MRVRFHSSQDVVQGSTQGWSTVSLIFAQIPAGVDRHTNETQALARVDLSLGRVFGSHRELAIRENIQKTAGWVERRESCERR